jgi:DNA-binding XRE family transcriptional regulator
MSITPAQCRAARGLVDFDQASLASKANVSRNTIVDFEKGKRVPNVNNLAAIRAALESAGVIFVDENGEGPGVRSRKTATGARAASIPLEDLNAENDE